MRLVSSSLRQTVYNNAKIRILSRSRSRDCINLLNSHWNNYCGIISYLRMVLLRLVKDLNILPCLSSKWYLLKLIYIWVNISYSTKQLECLCSKSKCMSYNSCVKIRTITKDYESFNICSNIDYNRRIIC